MVSRLACFVPYSKTVVLGAHLEMTTMRQLSACAIRLCMYSRMASRSQNAISQNQRSFSVRLRQYQMRSPSDIKKCSYLSTAAAMTFNACP